MGCSQSKTAIKEKEYKIPVPFNQYSKIAIIGGGAGGIHMAYELKKKGCQNVTVFEKQEHIGGKANSFKYQGGKYDTGTKFMMDDINVITFFKETNLYQYLQPIVTEKIGLYSTDSNNVISSKDFLLSEFQKITGNNELITKLKVKNALSEYRKLYDDLVDKFMYPKSEYARDLAKPVRLFLQEYNLEILYPFFDSKMKAFGYSRVDDDVPMFRALFFCHPDTFPGGKGAFRFKPEFGGQDIWEKIVSDFKINVK